MHHNHNHDAIVDGYTPNGLAAGITLTENGLSVLILEAKDFAGGSLRTAELTESGFLNDICSALHPLAVASPFFQKLPLSDHGLKWFNPAYRRELGRDRPGRRTSE